MSRFTAKKGNLVIAFGFDPVPITGGYFFQVFDPSNPDEPIVNEGFTGGLRKSRMLELMEEYDVGTEAQRTNVALDLEI